MSKHDRNAQRAQRKAERSRRCSRNRKSTRPLRHSAVALTAAGALAAGTQAYAAPIRYDNPPGLAHFDWYDPPGLKALDIALPASLQPGDPSSDSAIRQYVNASAVVLLSHSSSNHELQTGYAFPESYFVVGVNASDPIPTPGTSWRSQSAYVSPYYGYPSLLTPGEQTYLGARFDLGGGWQYAWIGVYVGADYVLDAFAWGYETEPGVPIAAGAPEPGSLALLAFGAVGVVARRRKYRKL